MFNYNESSALIANLIKKLFSPVYQEKKVIFTLIYPLILLEILHGSLSYPDKTAHDELDRVEH